MSMIDFQAQAAALSQDERRDVRDMLELIAHKLAGRSSTGRGMRRRLDAIVANPIAVADVLDGECDEDASEAPRHH